MPRNTIAPRCKLPYAETVNARTWKAWLVPGGLLLALAATVVNTSWFVEIVPSLAFYYLAVFTSGSLLAWRFNSSRILFSLLTLLLAHRAVDFFAAGQLQAASVSTPSGRTAVELAALLIPLNFIFFAQMRERGLIVAGIVPRFALLFFESVIFALLCRPESSFSATAGAKAIPFWILLSPTAAIAVFFWRFSQTRKPIEPAYVWSVACVFLWLQFGPLGKVSDAYVATAALILGAALIETSYVLAYQDELTGIRGRRAFNESLLALDHQYAIAIVDIDRFKKFNDTYGHDVGDQVLCMVAKRLTLVGGHGQAFRCGGEEFAIIFRNTSAKDACEHLEALRGSIEAFTFHVRGSDRRAERTSEKSGERRGSLSDRRRPTRKKVAAIGRLQSPEPLSVTVSIGVAEPSTRYREPEQVIQAADQALYRAKQKGRNRVEIASTAALQITANNRARTSRL